MLRWHHEGFGVAVSFGCEQWWLRCIVLALFAEKLIPIRFKAVLQCKNLNPRIEYASLDLSRVFYLGAST